MTEKIVHQAATWLARLRKISVTTLKHYRTKDTMSRALRYLRDVEMFHMGRFCYFHVDDLLMMAARCTWLVTFKWEPPREFSTPGVQPCLAAIVRQNPRLEEIYLYDAMWLTDGIVEAIAGSCPRLRLLKTDDDELGTALTDRPVTKLAQGCPKLRQLVGCSGLDVTDLSVLALAEHCRHLEKVDLSFASQVTEAALRHLQERAPG